MFVLWAWYLIQDHHNSMLKLVRAGWLRTMSSLIPREWVSSEVSAGRPASALPVDKENYTFKVFQWNVLADGRHIFNTILNSLMLKSYIYYNGGNSSIKLTK